MNLTTLGTLFFTISSQVNLLSEKYLSFLGILSQTFSVYSLFSHYFCDSNLKYFVMIIFFWSLSLIHSLLEEKCMYFFDIERESEKAKKDSWLELLDDINWCIPINSTRSAHIYLDLFLHLQ